MQIKFVQTEIEAAIRDRILEQVTVEEGMEIRIDLKATRGAEGYQAIIDIVPEGTPTAEQVLPAVTRTPQAAGTVSDPASGITPGRRKRRTKAEMEADRKAAEQGQVETAPEAAVEAAPETADGDPVITTGADEQDAPTASETVSEEPAQETPELVTAETTSEAPAEEAPAPSARPSIFSGLNKPVNS